MKYKRLARERRAIELKMMEPDFPPFEDPRNYCEEDSGTKTCPSAVLMALEIAADHDLLGVNANYRILDDFSVQVGGKLIAIQETKYWKHEEFSITGRLLSPQVTCQCVCE